MKLVKSPFWQVQNGSMFSQTVIKREITLVILVVIISMSINKVHPEVMQMKLMIHVLNVRMNSRLS